MRNLLTVFCIAVGLLMASGLLLATTIKPPLTPKPNKRCIAIFVVRDAIPNQIAQRATEDHVVAAVKLQQSRNCEHGKDSEYLWSAECIENSPVRSRDKIRLSQHKSGHFCYRLERSVAKSWLSNDQLRETPRLRLDQR